VTVAVVTGSAGLIGSEAARHFVRAGLDVVGIDNDLRAYFFGPAASTAWNRTLLERELGGAYRHEEFDLRDAASVERLFAALGRSLALVVHCASQPSHDWAAREPLTDFEVNATATLHLLEATRRHAPEAVFVFLSTNKVYGDAPNALPLIEEERRWELPRNHPFHGGIPESLSIDQSLHSLFGVSKAAADLMVQEYGRYFGLRTACLRGGCLTGPGHSGAELHGFLAYLMRCAATGRRYRVYGYKGKQVRDNIHSGELVGAVDAFFRAPRAGAVYNIGGGRTSNCSMLEAIELCQEITGRPLDWTYDDRARRGDHLWWISDTRRFRDDFPGWRVQRDVAATLREIYEANRERWASEARTGAGDRSR
jgi:CDP-paratose 2-epimerase